MKNRIALKNCLHFIDEAIKQNDDEMLRNYFEQFRDLVTKSIKEM